MRMIFVDENTDLHSLSAKLLTSKAHREGALAKLQSLNPHVDFGRIEAGTVLLVPELPGFKESETTSVNGQSFVEFKKYVTAALKEAETRIQSGHEDLAAQRQEVTKVFRTAAFKRAVGDDQDLLRQVGDAAAVFEQDQQQGSEAARMLATLLEAKDELDRLARLVG